ncbi:hypothetical protein DFH09DRAFT_1359165 [Mycena vulgaris]|nr:hypothetical protein DFH09DRAFT_1359165 [Mycena vulgaris]
MHFLCTHCAQTSIHDAHAHRPSRQHPSPPIPRAPYIHRENIPLSPTRTQLDSGRKYEKPTRATHTVGITPTPSFDEQRLDDFARWQDWSE